MQSQNIIVNQDIPKKIDSLVQTSQIRFQDTLSPKDSLIYTKMQEKVCCDKGVIGFRIYFIVNSSIHFVFIIAALSTLIKKNANYIALSAVECPSSSIPLFESLGIDYSYNLIGGEIDSFKNFWCNIGSLEDGILISNLIFTILYLAFEIFSYLILKKVIKLEMEGIFYYIIVFTNIIFIVIFFIYFALVFYLFAYTVIVLSTFPSQINKGTYAELTPLEENWNKNKVLPVVNVVFKFLVFIFNSALTKIKISVPLYLNKKFDDNNNTNEKIKTKTLIINNKSLKAEIKINQNLYLSRVNQIEKPYKFKKIKIEGATNGFIYILNNNKALTDQLSLTDWEYTCSNELFLKLEKIAKLIYGVLFVSIPLFKLHLNNEYNYFLIINSYKASSLLPEQFKPKFFSTFMSYGGFESGTVNSRFTLYVIALFLILISMLKRAFYGGYSHYIASLMAFITSIIFIFENIIYVILSFFMVLFSILSLVCFYDLKLNTIEEDVMIQVKLFIQIALNFIIFSICIRILIDSIQLTKMLNKLRIEVKNLSDGTPSEDQENIERFQYTGLDGQQHILNTIQIEGHPKFVYYTLTESTNNVNKIEIIPNNRQNTNSNPQAQNEQKIGIYNENANNNVNQINNNEKQFNINSNANQIHKDANQIFSATEQINNNTNLEPNNNTNSVFGGEELLRLRNENNSLREKNNELMSELQRLRKNLGNK